MKHLWEASDIRPGRIICREPADASRPDYSYMTSTAHKIGWRVDMSCKEGHYVLVSLADGMVGEPRTAEQMAESINAGKYVPIKPKWLTGLAAYWVEQSFYLEG